MKTAESTSFEFGEVLSATRQLQQELRSAVIRSVDPAIAALARELDEAPVVGASDDTVPLTIALVGQYNAGKSTILSVLTGRADIAIDSDVCTDEVTAYDWNGVRLLDTPGVHAGRPDHDEKTRSTIDRADLLVFVVTNELFDGPIGRHFRELAFERMHGTRMLLVVNKMSQDPGSPEAKRPDIEKVIAPQLLEDFRTVFIDARSWLEAQDADDEDREDLMEIANIGAFTTALNDFMRERGHAGRLSAPLFAMRSVAEHASALLATDFNHERAALELLHRKRGVLLASRGRLRSAMGGLVARAVADIGKYGDEVAEAIEPGKTGRDVEALHDVAQARARARSEELSTEARRAVEGELDELGRQLEALRDGVLARELAGQAGDGAPGIVPGEFTSPAWQARSHGEVTADRLAKARKAGSVAKDIGDWAARWASGPAAGDGITAFSIATARGSDAHKAVYNVGKFFGVKFQPWGAVKVARGIGNAGRVISAVGGILGVVGQIAEDRQHDQHRLQLREARDGVRSAYRDSAHSMEAAFWQQFETFVADFFGSELVAIDELATDLVRDGGERRSGYDAFQALGLRASALIERVTTRTQLALAA